MEAVIVVLVALAVGAVGLWLGILVAPAIGQFAERVDQGGEDVEPGDDESVDAEFRDDQREDVEPDDGR